MSQKLSLRKVKLMKVRAHIFVSGRVQGVFFRSEVRYKAKKYGVNGWVRNLRNGKVEFLFEGMEDSVKELVEFCRQGSRGAKVTHVEVKWERYAGEFEDFKIKYSF